MDIGEFIVARLDEEEADARAATAGPWRTGDHPSDAPVVYADGGVLIYDEGGHSEADAAHIARQDPAATLTRVVALRALAGEHEPIKVGSYFNEATQRLEGDGQVCELCSNRDREYGWEGQWPCTQLRHVAAIWASHPDYRAEWKP